MAKTHADTGSYMSGVPEKEGREPVRPVRGDAVRVWMDRLSVERADGRTDEQGAAAGNGPCPPPQPRKRQSVCGILSGLDAAQYPLRSDGRGHREMACGLKRLTEEERGGAWTFRQKKPHEERAVFYLKVFA